MARVNPAPIDAASRHPAAEILSALLEPVEGNCPACGSDDLHSAGIDGKEGMSCGECDWATSYEALRQRASRVTGCQARPRDPCSTLRPMAVEEDGDEIFTPMDRCYRCSSAANGIVGLENKNGFMCCVKCGGSYGEAPKAGPA